jgi:hypothetical protein
MTIDTKEGNATQSATVEALQAQFVEAMKYVMDYSNDSHLVYFARDTLAKIGDGK